MSQDHLSPPLISVVTINFNMAHALDLTIQSVLGQSYPQIEYVVIDGGSRDDSIDIIRQHADHLAYWISEPDHNLYDAMNKGVRASTGEWVVFMNSGDVFADPQVVADMFAQDNSDADLVYGHARRKYGKYDLVRECLSEPPSILPWRMNCSHQSVFARRELLLQHPLGDRLAADYEFLLTALVEKRRFKLIDRIVAEVSAGGLSDTRRLQSLFLRWKALSARNLATPYLATGYLAMAVRSMVGQYGKALLGKRLTSMILNGKRGGRL